MRKCPGGEVRRPKYKRVEVEEIPRSYGDAPRRSVVGRAATLGERMLVYSCVQTLQLEER